MAEYWDILDENGNKTGRLHKRGEPLLPGDFHLVIGVWIMNPNGEFLISKRSPDKYPLPNMWENTGGSAVTGDDSLTTALKEVREELGITLNPADGVLFRQSREVHQHNGSGMFIDIWLFFTDVNLDDVVLQEGETCDARLACRDTINRMMLEGTFIERKFYPYLDEMFTFVEKHIN